MKKEELLKSETLKTAELDDNAVEQVVGGTKLSEIPRVETHDYDDDSKNKV